MSESIRAIPPFVDAPAPYVRQRAARPTAREWARHAALFFLTFITTTIAGITLVSTAEPTVREPVSWLDYILYIPAYYLSAVAEVLKQAVAQPHILAQGLTFAVSLLAILAAHEAGHYVACRRYGVDATLPFFIPAPPLFLAGTFGAFIKIKSYIPTKRALFDIGVAGPLAGFLIIIPVAIAGILTSHPAPQSLTNGELQHVVIFNDPLLLRLFARALGVRLDNIEINPFYFAAWIGLLVTSLNLIPVGQLDGGHATFAVFGAKSHRWIGRAAFVIVATLAVLGWFLHGSPSGFLYTILLAVMLRVRHPQTDETQPLGIARTIVALITLIVFILSFWPFPITIN
ncbi:MAG: site-2 protease family protein [Pyrinomonadaceae bacterium]